MTTPSTPTTMHDDDDDDHDVDDDDDDDDDYDDDDDDDDDARSDGGAALTGAPPARVTRCFSSVWRGRGGTNASTGREREWHSRRGTIVDIITAR